MTEDGSGSDNGPEATQEFCGFYGIEDDAHKACTLEERKFIITEMTLDTGATTDAADRLDFQ